MLEKITQWYDHKKHARFLYAGVFSVVVLGVLLTVEPASAQWYNPVEWVNSLVSNIIQIITNFLGNILLLSINILIGIFKYNDFINTPAVQLGWVIIRDISNIGIAVALMVIAFSTVFQIKQYSASQLLVRLVIAAILVNFSRLIAGLMIDAGQVVMMTFVNAFNDLAAGNLTVGFGIEDMLALSTGPGSPDLGGDAIMSVISSILLAIVMLVVAIGVVLAFIVVILQRIVFLWILVIFAPLAYVAPLVPGGSSISGKWWSEFGKQVTIGPIIAFGFWLSMSVLSGTSNEQHLIRLKADNVDDSQFSGSSDEQSIAFFASKVSTPQAMMDYMVVIALLLGTLWMAQQAGGAAGRFAGQIEGKMKSMGKSALYKGTGARYFNERYQAYKGQRESIRKEKASQSGARLSALRDKTLPSTELITRKGRERRTARVKQEAATRFAREMENANQAYDLYDNDAEANQAVYDGKGKAGKSKMAQAQAAMFMSKARNGFGTGKEGGKRIDQLHEKLGEHIKFISHAEDETKRNSTDAADHSYLYFHIADEDNQNEEDLKKGSKKVLNDTLNGVRDAGDLNKKNLYNQVKKGQSLIERDTNEQTNVLKTLVDGSRNGEQFTQLAKRIVNKDVREDMAKSNSKGMGLESEDKKLAVGAAGYARAAWGDLREEANYKAMNTAMEDIRYRRNVMENSVKSEFADKHVAKSLSEHSSGSEMEKFLSEKENREALSKGFEDLITDIDNDNRVSDKHNGDTDEQKYIKKVRRNQLKSTKDVHKAYGTTREGREALRQEIKDGKFSGSHFENTDLGRDPELLKMLGEEMTVAQIVELQKKNSLKAQQVINNVNNPLTRKALQKNDVTAKLTPETWPDYTGSSSGSGSKKSKKKKKS